MNNHSNHLYDFGKYRLDAEKRVLFRGEQAVHLPLKAIDLLIVLVERHGQVVSKEQLMELLWRDTIVEEANLAQNIFLLRKLFSENSGGRKWIETIPRRGYRFVAKVKEPLPATNPTIPDSPLKPITDQSSAPMLTAEENDQATPQDIPGDKEALTETSATLPTVQRKSLSRSHKLRLILLTALLFFAALAAIVYLNRSRKPAPTSTPGRVPNHPIDE